MPAAIQRIFQRSRDGLSQARDQTISLEIPVERTREPPKIVAKTLAGISFLWDTLIITPFLLVWRFLARYTNLTFWIIFSMVVGILVGNFAPDAGKAVKPLGTAFINMIKIVEVPLIFSTLVVGIAGHGDDVSKVGKLAVKTIIYFEVVTTFALFIGLAMANLVKPGAGVILPADAGDTVTSLEQKNTEISWDKEMFLIIPENFFVAAYNGSILGVVFCAVMFSCATMLADKTSRNFMLRINSSLSQVMFKFVGLVMNYAPIGIGCALAATVGSNGISVLANLGKLIGCLYASLFIFVLIILLPIMLIFNIPVFGFFKAVSQPWLIAFSSASSESALPKAFERMREFGCPNAVTGFVIPCGYSFNLDGTTLYLSLASIFSAQAAGLNLPVATQLSILGTLMLSSKGVAAIPRASLIVLTGTLQQYNLPLSAVTLIMGADAIMDMIRTSVNVFGNCLGCCVMSRIEGSFRGEIWREEELERRRAALASQEAVKEHDDDASSIHDVETGHHGPSSHHDNLKAVVVHEETSKVSLSEKSIQSQK